MDDIARENLKKIFGTAGQPVPTVDPQDVKAVWELNREVMARHPGKQVGICITITASRCSAGADVKSVAYRARFLGILEHMAPGLLETWNKDGKYQDCLFRALATMPLEWPSFGAESKLTLETEGFVKFVNGAPWNDGILTMTRPKTEPAA